MTETLQIDNDSGFSLVVEDFGDVVHLDVFHRWECKPRYTIALEKDDLQNLTDFLKDLN